MIGKVNYDSYYFDELAKLVYDESPSMRDKSSPNNIRRVIIGANAIAVDRFVGGCKVFNISPEKRDRCLRSPTCKQMLSAIAGIGDSRVCSNVEELIFCDGILSKIPLLPPESLFSTEALPLKSAVLKRTPEGIRFNSSEGNKFKRLRYICSLNAPIEAVRKVLTDVRTTENRYDYTIGGDDVALSNLGVIARSDLRNTSWYTHHSLRKETYSLDNPNGVLASYFNSADRFLVSKARIDVKTKSLAQAKDKQLKELSTAVSVFCNTYKYCKFFMDIVLSTNLESILIPQDTYNILRSTLLSVKSTGIPDSSLLDKSFKEKCNKWGIVITQENGARSSDTAVKVQVDALYRASTKLSSALLSVFESALREITSSYPVTRDVLWGALKGVGRIGAGNLDILSSTAVDRVAEYYSSLSNLLTVLSILCLSANKRGDDEVPVVGTSTLIKVNISKLKTKDYWKELLK